MPTAFFDDFIEKTLVPREIAEPEARLRLESEASLLALLAAAIVPNVTPPLLARGSDAARGPWHRIERIRLPTLAEHIAKNQIDSLWIERAVVSAFTALASIHEARDERDAPLHVVHADLSPTNLLLNDRGDRVVVIDFDLAWWRDGPPRNDGAFRGTVAYVAPEIARGEPPTPRSDLFALAASFLHAMKGTPPRESSSFAAMLARAAEIPILDPDLKRDATIQERSGRAHAVILQCLAHDPNDRPRSARDVAMLGKPSR